MSKTVLLISNCLADETGGRAEKIATRTHLLERYGWNVVIGHAPKPYVSGTPRALKRCIRIAQKENIDAVLSINNPYHLHILGYLTSKYLRKPWLAELRDPIASHPGRNPISPNTWGAKAVEHLVIHEAHGVVWFDGIQLTDAYFDKYRSDNSHITKLPPMGYRRDKFDSVKPMNNDLFTITYAGSFYDGWIEPYSFLSGFKQYIESTNDRDIQVQFYGDWKPEYNQYTENLGIMDLIKTHDPIPHDEIIPILKGSDVLLYIGGEDEENKLNLPSKLWDYVGAKKPILSIVDPSFRAAEFVRSNRLGVIASPSSSTEIADGICTLKQDYNFQPKKGVFEKYTRERSAERIAQVLNDISKENCDNL